MKIVKPNAVIALHDIPAYQFIEKVGRTAYKSEDKITKDSAVQFVKNMVKSNHWAVLEHEYLYVYCSNTDILRKEKYLNCYDKYITGSFRAWHEVFDNIDHTWTEEIALNKLYKEVSKQFPEVFQSKKREKFIENYTWTTDSNEIYAINRNDFVLAVQKDWGNYALVNLIPHTILFTCDRGVTHELVRHRPCSFLQESTRYVNYSKGKYGSEITVIEPCFFEKGTTQYNAWAESCSNAELFYMKLIESGAVAQEARSVLPTSVKADIYLTATEVEWQHIIDLRYHGTTGRPHPQMLEIMSMAYPQLIEVSEGRIV